MLSCRILGRDVEKTFLAFIVEMAKKENAKELIGEFIPTKKNVPAKDFYKENDFKLTGKEKEIEKYSFDLKNKYDYPKFIEVK